MACKSPGGTILVVDDSADIRRFGQKCLEKAGYRVITASDGEEGLRFYQENQPGIVLLLTDVRMPNINGLELAERVLTMDSTLPVLFMSGDSWSAHRGLECLAKPFGPEELIETVDRVLYVNARSQQTASAAS